MSPPEDPKEDHPPPKATPFNVPPEKPLWWSLGHDPATSKIVIEVETDEGLDEAPSVDVLQAVERMKEGMVGPDPLDITGSESRCCCPRGLSGTRTAVRPSGGFGAIEIGLPDLRGKACG